MTKITYDLSLLTGTALIGAGTWALCGVAVAAIAVGSLVIALTLIGATLLRKA